MNLRYIVSAGFFRSFLHVFYVSLPQNREIENFQSYQVYISLYCRKCLKTLHHWRDKRHSKLLENIGDLVETSEVRNLNFLAKSEDIQNFWQSEIQCADNEFATSLFVKKPLTKLQCCKSTEIQNIAHW